MSAPDGATRGLSALFRRILPGDLGAEVCDTLDRRREELRVRRGSAAAWLWHAAHLFHPQTLVLAVMLRRRQPARRRRSWGPGVSWIDVKLGLRILRRYPALTLVGILPMAATVAAVVGAFVVSRTILHPQLPLDEGDRVVAIQQVNVTTQVPEMRIMGSFLSWRRELRTIEELSASSPYGAQLGSGGEPSVQGSRITASAFRVARVPPLLGRTLLDVDERPAAPEVVVIGYDLWKSRLGSAPDIVGRTLRVDGTPRTVVGVMPSGFHFPFADNFWIPLRPEAQPDQALDGPPLYVFGRLREGVRLQGAQAELDVFGRAAATDDPESFGFLRTRVSEYAEAFWGGPTAVFYGAQLALVALLLVVCATVGSLVYVRNLSREAELTMRFRLGATRERIVTQLFVESLVMSAFASAIGYMIVVFGLPWAFARLVATSAPGTVPFWVRPVSGGEAMVYVAVLATLSAAVSGLLPALTLTTTRRGAPLTRVAAGTARVGRKGAVVVAGQTALTVGLLTLLAGLFPYVSLSGRPAYEADARRYLTAGALGREVPADFYDLQAKTERLVAGMNELVQRLSAQPDVEGATLASALPGEPVRNRVMEVEGEDSGEDEPTAQVVWIGADYFDVMQIPIVAGRAFESGDFRLGDATASVVIVNESLAQRWFGEQNPIGRRVRILGRLTFYPRDTTSVQPWSEIVGVVGDAGMDQSRPTRPDGIYMPMRPGRYLTYVIALARSQPGTLGSRMSLEASAIDPWILVRQPQTLRSVIASRRGMRRTVIAALFLATLTALLLSLSALYAIVSFFARQRSRNIGIRIALGGHPAGVSVRVLAGALKPLGIGIGVGVAVLWAARLATLVSVSWTVLLVMSAATVGAGVLACAVPALRAANMSLVEMMRDEG
jgi:putative ABC transport system permease protein